MVDVLGFALAGGVLLGGVVAGLARRAGTRRRGAAEARRSDARAEADRVRREAEAERQALLREAELGARERALALRAEVEPELRRQEEELGARALALVERQADLEARGRDLADLRARLAAREEPLLEREAVAARDRAEAEAAVGAAHAALEAAAGAKAPSVAAALEEAELEEARGAAAQLLRTVEQSVQDPEQGRRARRVMGIAVGRFAGHYLTERHLSLVAISDPRYGRAPLGEAELQIVAEAAGVRLTPTEAPDVVRLEGLDGVGREIARRCVARLLRRPRMSGEAVTRVAREVGLELEREILDFGRRAFSVLEIPRAHPEIVKLVGRLNWRTSYTQNQWKHAIEAAFLCGMLAEELGLDVKVARRAALMHDIGKALTHELDGSHAVIGADYARRLGEPEIVANAIGAHHTDEPFSSPYAYLVAAADAMSGARPGARRQTEDNYTAKIGDLERISRGFPGVAEAFAVQGGREVRVVVKEDRMGDADAVALSSRIAEKISTEMTFPGQIRVTVIREFKAIETAS